MTQERIIAEKAQKIRQTVEDWADGCGHTHDEPEDCLECTTSMFEELRNLLDGPNPS